MAHAMTHKQANVMGIAAVAAAMGAMMALLFAPKSGEEMRGDIKDRMKRAKDMSTDKMMDAKDTVIEKKDMAKDKISSLKSKMDDELADTADDMSNRM
jgi:gas vesicle protein